MKNLSNLFLIVLLAITFTFNSTAATISINTLPEDNITTSSKSYYLSNFITSKAETIALYAHPTSEYLGYRDLKVYGDEAYITLKLKCWIIGRYEMRVKVKVNSLDFISRVSVIRDEAYMPAFSTVSFILDAVKDLMEETDSSTSNRAMSAVERSVNQTIENWDGQDMCLFALNCLWIDGGYYASY